MATLKPTTPLLTPNKGLLKPAPPLHPKMHQKTPIRTRKGDDGFSRGSAGTRKGDRGFRQAAQLAYRAWLRCPRAATTPPHPKFRT